MLTMTAVGNLARDPELKTVNANGKDTEVTRFTVLCNRKSRDGDIVTAVDCSVWGNRARVVCDYLQKGSQVTVVGDGYVEQYERKDGDKGAKIVLRVNDFSLPPKTKQIDTPF
jgi:single-strand DNA-binding protein